MKPRERRQPTLRQQKTDKAAGFILFIVVNLVILAILQPASILLNQPRIDQLLPWLVNGGLLLAMFVVRPQMALGYMACPFILALLAAGAGVYAVISCVVSLASAVILRELAVGVFGVLMLVGLYYGAKWAIRWWNNWWEEARIEEWRHRSLMQQSATDHELLTRLQEGEIEIGDDGEIRPVRRKRDEDS